jgi:hypothetical protein
MRRRRVLVPAVLTAAAGVLAGCAGPDGTGSASPSPSATSSEPASATAPPQDQEYRYTGYAIGPTDGTEATLCGSLVLQSLPPQCGDGVTARGWDWSGVDAETASGTSFGEVQVVGTYDADAGTFTVTGAPTSYETPPTDPADERDYSTPCPEPEGGWASVAPSDPTRVDFGAAYAAVAAVEGYVIAWMDRDPGTARPDWAVLNVRTTGDVAATEAAARQHWTGPLCVTAVEGRSAAELDAVRAEIEAAHPELAPLNLDEFEGAVIGTAWVVPDDLQAGLDEEYGEGTVQLHQLLEPVD